MSEVALAVIGGTGVYKLAKLEAVEHHLVETRFGVPSGAIHVGYLGGKKVAFLARHGEGHSIAPHQINYAANLAALQDLGARRVLAFNTVGGITDRFGPRVLVCPDQLIDYTWGRISTICEQAGAEVLHVDFEHPYSPAFRIKILAVAEKLGMAMVDGGCCGVTQGPRLETSAEIARMRNDGCDLVGMTSMPEAALARELGLEYASVNIVANWAAGCGDGEPITMAEVLGHVEVASVGLPELVGTLAQA